MLNEYIYMFNEETGNYDIVDRTKNETVISLDDREKAKSKCKMLNKTARKEYYSLTIHQAIVALLDGHTVENETGVWVYQYRIKDNGWQYRRKHIDRRDSKYWEKTGVEEMWFTPDDLKARFRVVPKYKLEKWD